MPEILAAAGILGWVTGVVLRFMDLLTVRQFTVWNCVLCGLIVCEWIVRRRLKKAAPMP